MPERGGTAKVTTFAFTVAESPGDVPLNDVAPAAAHVIETPPPVVGTFVYVIVPIGMMGNEFADEIDVLSPLVAVAYRVYD
jgi:hypothetical protein